MRMRPALKNTFTVRTDFAGMNYFLLLSVPFCRSIYKKYHIYDKKSGITGASRIEIETTFGLKTLPRRYSDWATGWTSEKMPFESRQKQKSLLFFKESTSTLISGFRRDVDEICALLGYYAASCGNCLPTFQDNLSVPILTGQEYE
jgi:hypothetical protein